MQKRAGLLTPFVSPRVQTGNAGRERILNLCPHRALPTTLRWCAIALTLGAAACSDGQPPRTSSSQRGTRPSNLLLISIDTCRADAIACYSRDDAAGTGRATPHVDALSERAVRFENAIAPVPITLPSHSTMLTGTNPPYHGVHDNGDYRLADFNVSLAELARDAGYDTAAFIAAFVLDARFGLDQGFETYDDRLDDDNSLGLAERKAEVVTDAALEWLDRPREAPFFLFVHYYDPHQAYEPPPPFRPESGGARAFYDGEVSYTDHHIGRLLRRLEELGSYDDTLIVLTSDHGEMLDEHGERSHTFFVYQSALHVPLIIKPPFEVEPRIVPERVGIVDIVPTACALLGWTPPDVLHGRDLSPLLEGRDPGPWDRFVYCESMTPTLYGASPLLGLVTERWKYLHTTRPELYDLDADPGESRNLVDSDPARAAALRERLRSLLAEQHRGGDEARAELDTDVQQKIQALGYAGGGVSADFDLDGMLGREDPKDLIAFSHSDQVLQNHLNAGELAEARALGTRMLEERPDSVRTRLAMAWLHLDAGELDASKEHSRRVLELDPENKKALYVQGLALEKNGELDAAMEHYRIVVKLWPENTKAQFRLGSMLLRAGDAQAAIPHLRQAVAEDPDQPGTHANLGNALLSTGRPDEALAHFDTAARLQPDSAGSQHNRGFALSALGRTDEAMAAYRQALQLDPGLARSHHELGVLLQASGRADLALDQFLEALRDDPQRADTRVRAGFLLVSGGALDDGIAHLREAVELAPDSANARAKLGMALQLSGAGEEALRHLARAVELDGAQLQARVVLAELLASHPDERLRDPRRATELAELGVEQSERRVPRALAALAMAYANEGRFDDAVATAEEALRSSEAQGAADYAAQVRAQLELYRAGRPFRAAVR